MVRDSLAWPGHKWEENIRMVIKEMDIYDELDVVYA